MNQKIRELAVQSKLGNAEFGNGVQYYVATQETFEKFAELIVKECAEMGDNFDGQPVGNAVREYLTAGDAIREYFGVEE
jgi:hypothetical protein